MPHLFRTRRRDGDFHPRWRFEYIDYTGKKRKGTGFPSKKDTENLANKVQAENDAIRKGYLPAPKRSDRSWTFDEVALAYNAWGESFGGRGGRGWSSEHARKRKNQLDWWKQRLGIVRLRDLAGSLSRVEHLLQGLQAEGKTGKTVSLYAETISAFCDWCVKREYLDDDPLKNLPSIDSTPRERRRAMTVDEIRRLLKAAPPKRRLLYEVAFCTGLRRSELEQLTVGHLERQRGGLKLDASWTKNRREGLQILPRELLDRLVREARGKKASTPLLCVPSHTARALDSDLAKAKIEKRTPEGKIDFHACRVAYTTLVLDAGATVKEAQELLRHSTPELTMNIYARARDERLGAVVDSLGQVVSPSGQTVIPTCSQRRETSRGDDRGNIENEEPSDSDRDPATGVRIPPPPPNSSDGTFSVDDGPLG